MSDNQDVRIAAKLKLLEFSPILERMNEKLREDCMLDEFRQLFLELNQKIYDVALILKAPKDKI